MKNKGAGDGVKASSLPRKPTNFAIGIFKYGDRDEDLFSSIINGRGPMKPSNAALSEKDIFDVITYIRTLKK